MQASATIASDTCRVVRVDIRAKLVSGDTGAPRALVVSCIVYRDSCIVFRVLCFVFRVSGGRCQGVGCRV